MEKSPAWRPDNSGWRWPIRLLILAQTRPTRDSILKGARNNKQTNKISHFISASYPDTDTALTRHFPITLTCHFYVGLPLGFTRLYIYLRNSVATTNKSSGHPLATPSLQMNSLSLLEEETFDHELSIKVGPWWRSYVYQTLLVHSWLM